jgi:hypothetical protein
VASAPQVPPWLTSYRAGGLRGCDASKASAMRIDRADAAEWKLSDDGRALGFVREFCGAFNVYRSGMSIGTRFPDLGPYSCADDRRCQGLCRT